MTDQTPIERAGNALLRNRAYQAGVAFGVPDEVEAEAKHRSEIIKAVMGSIDTDELASLLAEVDTPSDAFTQDDFHTIALAVKNWLTGGE